MIMQSVLSAEWMHSGWVSHWIAGGDCTGLAHIELEMNELGQL